MDQELEEAVAEYRSQLSDLEPLLAADPDNTELQEVCQQLRTAIQEILEASGQAQQAQQEQQQQQQQEAQHDEAGGTARGDERGVQQQGEDGAVGAAGDGATVAGSTPPLPRAGAAGNARMHPANRYYRTEPDFAALAEQYEELRPYVTTGPGGRGRLETTSWEATRALTACLLRHDFGVKWWLPEGQLVPPVTNRANYVHWVNDLLHLSSPLQQQEGEEGPAIRGLDVGCGANLIYCLLGAVLYGWRMVGVDVTEVAVRCARQLVGDNPQLGPLLEVRDLSGLHPELQGPQAALPAGTRVNAKGGKHAGAAQQQQQQQQEGTEGAAREGEQEGGEGAGAGAGEGEAEDAGAEGEAKARAREAKAERKKTKKAWQNREKTILLPAFKDDGETFAFTMCNPPFFESMGEAARNPNTAFGGTAAEMVCPGGELAFVMQMVQDSEQLQDRVHWFTTMVGKKDTLKALRKELHTRHITALRTTEFAQGKTSRWGVAWSWQVHPNKASQPLRRMQGEGVGALGEGGQQQQQQQEEEEEGDEGQGRKRAHRDAAGGAESAVARPVLPRRVLTFTVIGVEGRQVLSRLQAGLEARGCSDVACDTAQWALSWPLQWPQVGPFGAAAGAKRPREQQQQPQAGTGGSWTNITARMRVAQQQRGRVEVMASVPASTPDAAARAFTQLVVGLQEELGA